MKTPRSKAVVTGRHDLSGYQRQLVAAGIKDAREGRFVDGAEMRRRLSKLKKKYSA